MKRVKDMVAAANDEVSHAPAADLLDQHGVEGVTFVDLRDPRELEREGMIPGAFHCPRGMLEFWIDPKALTPRSSSRPATSSSSIAPRAGVLRFRPR